MINMSNDLKGKTEGPSPSKLMGRSESVFKSTWMKIKEIEEEEESPDKISNKISKKAKKGGADDLYAKVKKSNISDWVDHKLHRLGFFENLKRDFVDEREMSKTYGEYSNDPPISRELLKYEDYEVKLLEKPLRDSIDERGSMMQRTYLQNGLTDNEANARLSRDGPNKLPEKKKVPEIVKIVREMTTAFNLLLWVAGALCFLGYGLSPSDPSNLVLAIVIVMIVVVTAFFSYYQNNKSEAVMNSFKNMNSVKVSVIRNGESKVIDLTELVKGDVVKFKIGEKVPADIRMITSNDLDVDNSALTGETHAIRLGDTCGEKGRTNPLEALNVAFFSTLCIKGSGTGIVIQTGAGTYMGRIADLTASAQNDETTLQIEVSDFVHKIAAVAITTGVAFFFAAIAIGYPIIVDFGLAVGIVVSNVPEALPSTVTISLAFIAKKMFKRRILVKNLQSVETLGSITCICSDKTGTLTQNKMTVVHVWYDLKVKNAKEDQVPIVIDGREVKADVISKEDLSYPIFEFAGVCGSAAKFLKETPDDYYEYIEKKSTLRVKNPKMSNEEFGTKCNQRKIIFLNELVKKDLQKEYDDYYQKNISERHCDGDASETGIIKFFEGINNIDEVRKKFPNHFSNGKEIKIPFNSKLKFACFLRQANESESPLWLAFKGAPEQLITRCNRYLLNGKERQIDNMFHEEFARANRTFSLKGERVLGIAYAKLDPNKYTNDFHFKLHPQEDEKDEKGQPIKFEDPEPNFPITDLCFVGLIALEDPPRPGVRESISQCKQAGIKVIMVTGDQSLTAASIAYQIGIIEDLDDTPEIIKERSDLATIEEAEAKSNTIIITGDRLKKVIAEDDLLNDDNPKKGQVLRNWLMKRDVVFARTSPEQKLIIVEGCQKLAHIVAVTGDGVNDSPAMKKADIGIAMGKVGTDVAKDAADILLLDDHFPNILSGIKEGRALFDVLKKIIIYNLTSNCVELVPFLGFIVIQFPLPMTTIFVLLMDCFSNIYPMISFAGEYSEANIMNRLPRNAKLDRLCTLRGYTWAYGIMGIVQVISPFIAYFATANDYGFPSSSTFFLINTISTVPQTQDIFNPYDEEFNGNSNAFVQQNSDMLGIFGTAKDVFTAFNRTIDYYANADYTVDIRLALWFWPRSDFGACYTHSVGMSYDGPVCYRTEAFRHAQTAFIYCLTITQTINATVCRTISTSYFKHLVKNMNLNASFLVEVALMSICVYAPAINFALGTRPLRIENVVPCALNYLTIFIFSEFVKLLIRRVKNPDGSNGFFYRYFYY